MRDQTRCRVSGCGLVGHLRGLGIEVDLRRLRSSGTGEDKPNTEGQSDEENASAALPMMGPMGAPDLEAGDGALDAARELDTGPEFWYVMRWIRTQSREVDCFSDECGVGCW